MRKALPLLLVAAFLLAGCAGEAMDGTTSGTPSVAAGSSTSPKATTSSMTLTPYPPPSSPPSNPPPADTTSSRMDIRGVVMDEALRPLRANVTILETGAMQETGAGGAFRFDGLRPDVYFLTARSAGFRPQTLSVTPEAAQQEVKFLLQANPTDAAFNQTVHFQGTFECALEVLIVSPSCDTVITSEDGLGRPDLALFNSTSTFTIDVQQAWKTVVVEVVFDGSAHPLLDGLRVTAQGTRNQTGLGTYEQYGRFHGKESFTFSLEPGATYPDGTAGAVPLNTTSFRFEVLPHSHAWHTVCVPGYSCFLGAGAGLDVQFDLYITTFYGKPAPEGFTVDGA